MRRRLPELIRFGAAGSASLLLDVGALVALEHLALIPLAVNTAIAFAAGALLNFALTRQWVFAAGSEGMTSERVGPEGTKTSTYRDLVRYALLVGADLVLTTVTVPLLAAVGVDYRVGKLLASGLVAAVNYVALPRWVFRT